jgi:hypothetical protein
MIRFIPALLLLAACSQAEAPAPGPDPAPPAAAVGPADLKALEAAHDWQHEPGAALNAAWNAGVVSLLGKMSRPEIIGAINAAGFECMYGEAHQDYPDPMAVCSRSFATRACQMDWEISSTAENGMVDEVDGSFRRDCVGTADDWPEPVVSEIDAQLAPTTPPQ